MKKPTPSDMMAQASALGIYCCISSIIAQVSVVDYLVVFGLHVRGARNLQHSLKKHLFPLTVHLLEPCRQIASVLSLCIHHSYAFLLVHERAIR